MKRVSRYCFNKLKSTYSIFFMSRFLFKVLTELLIGADADNTIIK